MIRSCALAAIAGLAAFGSAKVVAADLLPTKTFKILPAAERVTQGGAS